LKDCWDIAIVITLDKQKARMYSRVVLDNARLTSIRKKLRLTQEQMAHLLGVSFVSVNRWEGGHSSPTGPTLDLYEALEAAIRGGNTPEAIRQAANNERSLFLYALFQMAYARGRRSSR
jgi:DNA-binding transcriptional regulator YiaG